MADPQQKLIAPPLELVHEWRHEAYGNKLTRDEYIAVRAAQWGADQELEACIHWLITGPYGASIACHADHMIGDLRAARRPKPLSLKKQALKLLAKNDEPIMLGTPMYRLSESEAATIRRALEALPND